MSEHNIVILRGTLAGAPRTRQLPSGSTLTQLDLTTRDGGGTQSVPVAWFDPPASFAGLPPGAEVVVVGSVRRRFFRAGGATQSRTEVVAERVVPVARRRIVQRALDAASRSIAAAGASSSPEVGRPPPQARTRAASVSTSTARTAASVDTPGRRPDTATASRLRADGASVDRRQSWNNRPSPS